MLSAMVCESNRLTSLINNILDFLRIESGKKEYGFRETDVADLVRSTLEAVSLRRTAYIWSVQPRSMQYVWGFYRRPSLMRSAEAKLVWEVPGREEEEAVSIAHNADLVVMVLGLSARIEGEEMKVKAEGFAGGDRTTLELPAPQQQLLERVSATGRPLVLVLTNGSAVAVNWADEHVPAILEAWYPGESGGEAVQARLQGILVRQGVCR
jgi:Glycosyl hydrolase family 3 C-terminal domain